MNAAKLIALALALLPAPASAHVELDRAAPRVGSTVSAAPHAVVLNFSEAPDSASAEVRDVSGARVDVGGLKMDASDRRRALLKVRGLAPGDYSVRWRAKSDEGEETQGRFMFRVIP